MSFAILETIGGITRIISLPSAAVKAPSGLTCVDISAVTLAPQLGWITADGGKTFTDPTVPVLASVQAAQTQMLRGACRAAIGGGFPSSALGSVHRYPSDDASQRNLQAARGSSTSPLLLMCADSNSTWSLQPHTAAQIEQVNTDWLSFRQAQQQQLVKLTEAVTAATTVAAVQAIVWTEG